MSTYWGYHCKTDGESSEHWFNHGEAQLGEIAEHWQHIEPLRNTLWLEVTVIGGRQDALTWYAHHWAHEVELENEYGKHEAIPTRSGHVLTEVVHG